MVTFEHRKKPGHRHDTLMCQTDSITFKFQASRCIKASSLTPILFHQTTFIPVFRKQLPSSLYLRPILPLHITSPRRAHFRPYCLVEMISKSFIIQAFIALIVLASSLTTFINASPIAPAEPARQFLFLYLVD